MVSELAYGNVIPDLGSLMEGTVVTSSGEELIRGARAVSSIIGSIVQIAMLEADLKEAEKLMKEMEGITLNYKSTIPGWWKNWASLPPEKIVSDAPEKVYGYLAGLLWDLPRLADYTRKGWGTSKIYRHHYRYLQDLYYGANAWADAIFGIPQAIMRKKAERYWRRTVGGLLPSSRDLFIMWRKGLISTPTFEKLIAEATGYDPEIVPAYVKHLFYDPSVFDIYRVVRNVAVPREWIEKKLTELGLDDRDKEIFTKAAIRESLKDEIDRVWSTVLTDYGWGLYTEKELTVLLDEWELSDDEKRLRLLNAEVMRDKTAIKLARDADIYLLRTGVITPEECYGRLKLLGIDPTIANGIVRLEMAKMGVEWSAPR